MPEVIDKFTGKYAFLSNFYPVEILGYSTLEHAYQAMKTTNLEERQSITNCKTPGQAKRRGQHITLRNDWEDTKIFVMETLLQFKFSDPILKLQLFLTMDLTLVEGNTWHDNFWGSCICKKCGDKGENHLGQLLMKHREHIRKGIEEEMDGQV